MRTPCRKFLELDDKMVVKASKAPTPAAPTTILGDDEAKAFVEGYLTSVMPLVGRFADQMAPIARSVPKQGIIAEGVRQRMDTLVDTGHTLSRSTPGPDRDRELKTFSEAEGSHGATCRSVPSQ